MDAERLKYLLGAILDGGGSLLNAECRELLDHIEALTKAVERAAISDQGCPLCGLFLSDCDKTECEGADLRRALRSPPTDGTCEWLNGYAQRCTLPALPGRPCCEKHASSPQFTRATSPAATETCDGSGTIGFSTPCAGCPECLGEAP